MNLELKSLKINEFRIKIVKNLMHLELKSLKLNQFITKIAKTSNNSICKFREGEYSTPDFTLQTRSDPRLLWKFQKQNDLEELKEYLQLETKRIKF
jgi:hypothetical protein